MTHTQSKMANIEVLLMATWIARMVIRTTEVQTSVQHPHLIEASLTLRAHFSYILVCHLLELLYTSLAL